MRPDEHDPADDPLASRLRSALTAPPGIAERIALRALSGGAEVPHRRFRRRGLWWALASLPLVALWCLTLPEAPAPGPLDPLEKPRISIVSVDGFVVTEKPPEGGVWRIRSGSTEAPNAGTTLMIRQGGTP
ncbi:MAG TPA: hypothetical protein VGS22_01195 [Thermoanaerobaculia bacterium]|nr:hypothetical protein [Thermoanaerobaculia bacterium]